MSLVPQCNIITSGDLLMIGFPTPICWREELQSEWLALAIAIYLSFLRMYTTSVTYRF